MRNSPASSGAFGPSTPNSSTAHHMNNKKHMKEGHPSRKVGLRNLVVGFVLGLIAFGVGSLIQYTEQQMRKASAEYDRAVDAMMPYRQSKDCDCPENKNTAATKKKEKKVTHVVPSSLRDDKIQDFDPNAPVAIVTKIQGINTFASLKQSLCLLTYAYNQRVKYDVVVFSATEVSEEQLDEARAIIAPAKLIFVVDNPGIQVMVDELPDDRKQHLLDRCNVTDSSQLEWTTRCEEKSSSGTTVMPIAYNWQAEFRSLHVWKHPALAKYRYMIWTDTDSFCTKVWKEDPIATMRRNDLVILFSQFPAGRANGLEWIPKINKAFGKNICEISMRNGTLHAFEGRCNRARFLRQIYGFFHVTDLDFYRSDKVIAWQKIMIGDSKFSRLYDDQVAVTIPAAILAGNRSWHMRYFGVNLSIAHNFRMDGRKDEKIGSFKNFWKQHGKTRFPEAYGKCEIVSNG
jgi:hypothetical protein